MRRPTLAERYGLQPGPGVTEVVEQRTDLHAALQPLTNVRGDRYGRQLNVLVAGQLPPDPWAILQSEAMGWILDTLKRDHDLVVVDTPPLPHVADAISLLRHVDGVIVAASANSTRGDDARRLREQLQGLDARCWAWWSTAAPPSAATATCRASSRHLRRPTPGRSRRPATRPTRTPRSADRA